MREASPKFQKIPQQPRSNGLIPNMQQLILSIQQGQHLPASLLSIDANALQFGNAILHWKDIVAVRYGFWDKPRIGRAFTFIFKDRGGKEMKAEFDIASYELSAAEAMYGEIQLALQKYYGDAIVALFHKMLKSDGQVSTATCKARRAGIHFKTAKWLGTRDHFVAWQDLGFADSPSLCHILLGSKIDKAARLDFNLGGEWQGQYFIQYLQKLRDHPEMLAELKS